jgi:hypothetical protein
MKEKNRLLHFLKIHISLIILKELVINLMKKK